MNQGWNINSHGAGSAPSPSHLERQAINHRYTRAFAAVALTVSFLSGCGGGDSAPASTSPTATFPLQAGYKARIAAGSNDAFSISGTCGGTARITNSVPVAGIFEGAPALVATQTSTATLTGCTPASTADTSTVYFDSSSYVPLGYSSSGGEYAKTTATLSAIPASVKLGDTATVATQTLYASSAKNTVTGSHTLSYVVEPDTAANTAIVNLISKNFNASNQLLITQQDRYRIDAAGALTLLSIDVQASTTSTTHLVFTKT